jgi:hypothetical protein
VVWRVERKGEIKMNEQEIRGLINRLKPHIRMNKERHWFFRYGDPVSGLMEAVVGLLEERGKIDNLMVAVHLAVEKGYLHHNPDCKPGECHPYCIVGWMDGAKKEDDGTETAEQQADKTGRLDKIAKYFTIFWKFD